MHTFNGKTTHDYLIALSKVSQGITINNRVNGDFVVKAVDANGVKHIESNASLVVALGNLASFLAIKSESIGDSMFGGSPSTIGVLEGI